MPRAHLNQARADTLRPGRSAYDIRDADLKRFGVRNLPSGRIRYFIHGKHRGRRAR